MLELRQGCWRWNRGACLLYVAAAAALLLSLSPVPAAGGDAPQAPPPAADAVVQVPADDDALPAFTVPEVVVTARLIEESGQKVPITVTRVDADEMKQQGIERASDLTYTVPSLTIHPYFNTLTNSYSIRGLAAGQSTYFSESPCCSGSASIPFTDVESVQVLNGPQGTLFGRSSAAGAILITPVHPDPSKESGFAEMTVGDYGRAQFAGALNVPLIKDRLAVRLAFSANHVDGYTNAIGSDLVFDEQENQTLRLGAEWKGGRFENYAVATYMNLDQSATNQLLSGVYTDAAGGLYNLPAEAAPAVFGAVCTNAVALGLETNVDDCVTSRYNALTGIRSALLAEYRRVSAGGGALRSEPAPLNRNPARLRLRNYNVVNVAQYALRDEGPWTFRLKEIFSYEAAADVASSPADGIGGLAEQGGGSSTSGYGSSNQSGRYVVARLGPHVHTINNELQLHFGGKGGLIAGTIGLFHNYYRQPATSRGTGNVYQIFSGVFNENLGYNSALGFPAGGHGGETAMYAQTTLDLSGRIHGLSLTGGYRFTRSNTYSASYPAVLDPRTGVFSPGTTKSIARTKSSGPNYHFGITEQVTANFMAYATLSRAYVPGGVNEYDSGAGDDPSTELPNFAPTYGPETVLAGELGLKWDFRAAGVVGRVNADVYRYSYSDIQQPFSGTFNNRGFFYYANIAAATHQGFEVSATLVPSRAWDLRLSYNYNDFHYTDWTGQDPANVARPGDAICDPSSPAGYCFLDLTRNPAAGMPPHQGHLTVVYRVPIRPSLGLLETSATLYGQERVYFQSAAHRELQVLGPGLLQAYSQDPYAIVNLRAAWSNKDDRWAVGVFVNNATNQVYKLGTTAQVLSLGFGTASYGPPRMVGVELTRKF